MDVCILLIIVFKQSKNLQLPGSLNCDCIALNTITLQPTLFYLAALILKSTFAGAGWYQHGHPGLTF